MRAKGKEVRGEGGSGPKIATMPTPFTRAIKGRVTNLMERFRNCLSHVSIWYRAYRKRRQKFEGDRIDLLFVTFKRASQIFFRLA